MAIWDQLDYRLQLVEKQLASLLARDEARDTVAILKALADLEKKFMAAIDDLTAQVASNRTVIESALVLINGIAARITAAGTDPAALAALTADLKNEDDSLAAAVAANTPAAPTS